MSRCRILRSCQTLLYNHDKAIVPVIVIGHGRHYTYLDRLGSLYLIRPNVSGFSGKSHGSFYSDALVPPLILTIINPTIPSTTAFTIHARVSERLRKPILRLPPCVSQNELLPASWNQTFPIPVGERDTAGRMTCLCCFVSC